MSKRDYNFIPFSKDYLIELGDNGEFNIQGGQPYGVIWVAYNQYNQYGTQQCGKNYYNPTRFMDLTINQIIDKIGVKESFKSKMYDQITNLLENGWTIRIQRNWIKDSHIG